MKPINVRELHRRTGAIIDQVGRGESILITKRGVPVAEMRPASQTRAGFPPEHWEFLKQFPDFPNDSGRFISESRNRG